jgi:hypothetical protein
VLIKGILQRVRTLAEEDSTKMVRPVLNSELTRRYLRYRIPARTEARRAESRFGRQKKTNTGALPTGNSGEGKIDLETGDGKLHVETNFLITEQQQQQGKLKPWSTKSSCGNQNEKRHALRK